MARGSAGFKVTISGLCDVAGLTRETVRRRVTLHGAQRLLDDDSPHVRYELAEVLAAMGSDEAAEKVARLERARLALYSDRLLHHLGERSRVPRELLAGVAFLAGASSQALGDDPATLPPDWVAQIDSQAQAAAEELAPTRTKRAKSP